MFCTKVNNNCITMRRIGILSDTHGYWGKDLEEFFDECDELWHAGDIGFAETADRIRAFKPLRAVYGNIDDYELRKMFPEFLRFQCEGVNVLITHIGGYPGKYNGSILSILKVDPPNLFICGHSHILKVMFDKRFNLLHINPGAAGKSGLHTVRTAIRLTIEEGKMKDLEVLEIPR